MRKYNTFNIQFNIGMCNLCFIRLSMFNLDKLDFKQDIKYIL